MEISIIKSDSMKQDVIERLSKEGLELAVYFDEDPGDAFNFRILRPGVIAIAPPFNFDRLEAWWYTGNWQAIAPVAAGFEPFDTFRSTDSQIQRHVADLDIRFIIDSFHDNTDWKITEL